MQVPTPFHAKNANYHILANLAEIVKREYLSIKAVRNGDMNNALFVHMLRANHPVDWENTRLIYKVKDEKKRKIVEAAVINSVKNINLNDDFYKFDSLTTKYVIDAPNLGKTIRQLNSKIIIQGDVT